MLISDTIVSQLTLIKLSVSAELPLRLDHISACVILRVVTAQSLWEHTK